MYKWRTYYIDAEEFSDFKSFLAHMTTKFMSDNNSPLTNLDALEDVLEGGVGIFEENTPISSVRFKLFDNQYFVKFVNDFLESIFTKCWKSATWKFSVPVFSHDKDLESVILKTKRSLIMNKLQKTIVQFLLYSSEIVSI